MDSSIQSSRSAQAQLRALAAVEHSPVHLETARIAAGEFAFMLSSVSIENYRGFASYRMDGLSQVNLLVGKNNSGKTALLEGIQFLASGGDPAVLAEIAERRGELIGVDRRQFGVRRELVDPTHFFYGHYLGSGFGFSINGDNGYSPIKAEISSNPQVVKEEQSDRSEMSLTISGQPRHFAISPEGGVDFDRGIRFQQIGSAQRRKAPRVRFVSPDSLNSRQMAMMWDEVTIAGQEGAVAIAMRIIENRMNSVHFLTGMFASGHFPARGGIVIGFEDNDIRVPLGSLGDGMRRLMALAIALAFTKGGCLFVDEIDTGLHYSVMADMWKLVVKQAISSNTQVFATTHSWDCLEGLSTLCQRDPGVLDSVAVHKIDRALPNSIPFSGDSVVRMVKSDIDPR